MGKKKKQVPKIKECGVCNGTGLNQGTLPISKACDACGGTGSITVWVDE